MEADSGRATDSAQVRAGAIAAVQAGRRFELGLSHALWRGTFVGGESVIWSRGVVARSVGPTTLALGIAVVVVALSMTAPATAAVCRELFQGSPHAVFNHLRHARLRPAPLWPTYLPPSSRRAHWSVYGIRGAPLYSGTSPDPLASGPTAYSVNYGVNPSFCTGGASRGAGFSRTSTRAFRKAVQDSRVNSAPRHVWLGGRNVIEFRPYSSETYWGFLGKGGAYLFYSKDFGGPPSSAIGRMIASLRPITRLRPPT
jgi:hypothetical protein